MRVKVSPTHYGLGTSTTDGGKLLVPTPATVQASALSFGLLTSIFIYFSFSFSEPVAHHSSSRDARLRTLLHRSDFCSSSRIFARDREYCAFARDREYCAFKSSFDATELRSTFEGYNVNTSRQSTPCKVGIAVVVQYSMRIRIVLFDICL